MSDCAVHIGHHDLRHHYEARNNTATSKRTMNRQATSSWCFAEPRAEKLRALRPRNHQCAVVLGALKPDLQVGSFKTSQSNQVPRQLGETGTASVRLDRPCAHRLGVPAVGAEESLRRGRTKEMERWKRLVVVHRFQVWRCLSARAKMVLDARPAIREPTGMVDRLSFQRVNRRQTIYSGCVTQRVL